MRAGELSTSGSQMPDPGPRIHIAQPDPVHQLQQRLWQTQILCLQPASAHHAACC